jgi:hypothetical protein
VTARFKERWEHEITEHAIVGALMALRSPGVRVTIGFFDQWAKTRAAELGLRLVGTADLEVWRDDFNRKVMMRATVLLENVDDAPVIEGEAVRMHDMGLVPYIRQIEAK